VLAAYLRGEPTGGTSGSTEDLAAEDAWHRHQFETEKVITNALLGTVPVDATGLPRWGAAHPYLQTYLMQHAADAGTEAASALVQDEGFLKVTDQVTFSPYRGLAAFGLSDAPFFFGRDEETAHVLELLWHRLKDPGLLIVSGASGVGKSSLLQAGVVAALRRGALPGAASWPSIVFTPGRRPLHELAVQTTAVAGSDAMAVRRELWPDLAHIAYQATVAASARAAGDHEATARAQPRLLLIVDQFEQLFTAGSDQAERRAFITALHEAATGAGPAHVPPALVVLGVRADFETRCAEYWELRDAIVYDRYYLVPPMSSPQLRRAICGPAKAAGFLIEAGLDEVLLRDATGSSGAVALPLLSYALDQIWRIRSGNDLTIADYMRTGGIDGAAAKGAERAYERLTRSQQEMARRLLMRLIATSEDGVQTAHPVSRAELTGSVPAGQAEDLLTVIEAFTSAGLFTLTHDNIALSHEVLVTAWPRLHYWLRESQAKRIVRTQLSTAATEWARSGRDPAYQYTGSLLASAQAAAGDTNQMPLSPGERDFLHFSIRSNRRSMRRRHIFMALLLVLLVGFVAETFVLLSH